MKSVTRACFEAELLVSWAMDTIEYREFRVGRCGPLQPPDVSSPAVPRPAHATTNPIPLNCPSCVLILVSDQKQETSQCVKREDNSMA